MEKTAIIFDIETTAIPVTGVMNVTKCHCVSYTIIPFTTQPVNPQIHLAHTPEQFAHFISLINNTQILVAHNGITFDIPLLKKFFPEFNPKGDIIDTLVMSRALWFNLFRTDFKLKNFPPRLRGSHSLEAHGYRLGVLKGEFKYETDWSTYTPEMGEYCKQDVKVTFSLYNKIMKSVTDNRIFENENKFAELMYQQKMYGVYFDKNSAIKLMSNLYEQKTELLSNLQDAFPMRIIKVDNGKVFKSKVNNKKRHITKGSEYCKIKYEDFNPGSRSQIASRLQKLGWEPSTFTDAGNVATDEKALNEAIRSVIHPGTEFLTKYLLISKRLSQLSEGDTAWLKHLTPESRIHCTVNSGGTISGRCSHSMPNLSAVPKVGKPYGADCRKLFTATPGKVLVGCDASQLELRCLAHYLYPIDGGEYANIILEGDAHTANQLAAGLPERNMAKTFIYGWLYGAGAEKLGKIVNGGTKEGKRLKNKFMKSFPQIEELTDRISDTIKTRGYLIGLDGRHMYTRSAHSAPNLLLQSAGGLLMKRALIECDKMATSLDLDYNFVLNSHDEWQTDVSKKDANKFAEISVTAIIKAGDYFNFRIPLDGEAKIGKTWRDTH